MVSGDPDTDVMRMQCIYKNSRNRGGQKWPPCFAYRDRIRRKELYRICHGHSDAVPDLWRKWWRRRKSPGENRRTGRYTFCDKRRKSHVGIKPEERGKVCRRSCKADAADTWTLQRYRRCLRHFRLSHCKSLGLYHRWTSHPRWGRTQSISLPRRLPQNPGKW